MSETNKKRKKPIRDIPAYQEYASDVLANLNWRMMSFSERGLWDTLRKECWVNGAVPCDPNQLAPLLNKPTKEIINALTLLVKSGFKEVDGMLVCPELDLYKADRLESRESQSKGGMQGGLATQAKIRERKALAESEGQLKVLSRGESNRADMKGAELPTKQRLIDEHKKWLSEYDAAD